MISRGGKEMTSITKGWFEKREASYAQEACQKKGWLKKREASYDLKVGKKMTSIQRGG